QDHPVVIAERVTSSAIVFALVVIIVIFVILVMTMSPPCIMIVIAVAVAMLTIVAVVGWAGIAAGVCRNWNWYWLSINRRPRENSLGLHYSFAFARGRGCDRAATCANSSADGCAFAPCSYPSDDRSSGCASTDLRDIAFRVRSSANDQWLNCQWIGTKPSAVDGCEDKLQLSGRAEPARLTCLDNLPSYTRSFFKHGLAIHNYRLSKSSVEGIARLSRVAGQALGDAYLELRPRSERRTRRR